MKLVTWNVNSLRARIERVTAFLERHEPDVLCLQETKVVDDAFPREALEALGYHVAFVGQRTYNGVAVISREAPSEITFGFDGNPVPREARVIGVMVAGLRVICCYVINGQSIESDKYPLKLEWLAQLGAWIRREFRPDQPLIVAGDFNIAPDDRDVYDPEGWRGKVLCSDPERAWLRELCDWGLVDLLRAHEEEEGVYSWWDYRFGAFHRNHGLRIDLILGTAPVAGRCREVVVDRDERKSTSGPGKPSDHAPVIALLDDSEGRP